jgi:hypothetical protein
MLATLAHTTLHLFSTPHRWLPAPGSDLWCTCNHGAASRVRLVLNLIAPALADVLSAHDIVGRSSQGLGAQRP